MSEEKKDIKYYGAPDGSIYYFDENGELIILESHNDSFHILDMMD